MCDNQKELIKFFDYPKLLKPHRDNLIKILDESLLDGVFVNGEMVSTFEREFAKYTGSKYAVGVSSGTDGLLSILLSLDIPKGSDVLVTSYTFIASAEAIKLAGLNPVFVDVSENSFHPKIDDFEKYWTKNTKAVMFVHLFGETLSVEDIKKLCYDKNVHFLEDCAESFGSYYPEGGHAGTKSIASAFSFFPSKTLGCLGDGGMVLTNNKVIYDKLKNIRNHGSFKRYYHNLNGGNMRLDSIQAGFLSVLLKNAIPKWLLKRKKIADFYLNNINNPLLTLPKTKNFKLHSWYLFSITTTKRDSLFRHLTNNNIECFIYWPLPLHKQPIFKEEIKNKNLPISETLCESIIHIPLSPHLTNNEIEYISKKLNEFK